VTFPRETYRHNGGLSEYGYLKPGKEDRKALFKKGLMIGVILALVFVGLGIVFAGT